MTNDDVISAWVTGRTARAGHLRCAEDGKLYSYSLLIGEALDGRFVAYNYTSSGEYVSKTTSRHAGLAMAAANETRCVAVTDPLPCGRPDRNRG